MLTRENNPVGICLGGDKRKDRKTRRRNSFLDQEYPPGDGESFQGDIYYDDLAWC